jgi:uncharacterized protein
MNAVRYAPAMVAILGSIVNSAASAGTEGTLVLRPVQVKAVQIHDRFWAPKQATIRQATIAHSWPYVQSSIDGFLSVATPEQRPVKDLGCWSESNLYKVLETAAYAMAQEPDPALDHKVNDVISMIAAGQQPDGFIHAWTVLNKRPPWGDL